MTIRTRAIPALTRLPYEPESQDVNMFLDESTRDNLNRLKVSVHQNIYDADFEYGLQPLRWEGFTAGGGTITHLPQSGGVRMRLGTAAGDITMRQTRPYHRYQPGKTMFMASAINFGTANVGQTQRVGFFDDANGVFLEEGDPTTANPAGISAVVRSDASGVIVDTKVPFDQFLASDKVRASIDWTRIQMIWLEYAWYGAGLVRWGIFLDGEPILLHKVGYGNRQSQTGAWARTGNLPVRYEQRNTSAQTTTNDMIHYGVSVIVEGGVDDQRGFTYSYGMAAATPLRTVTSGVRYPLLSFRGRTMGTQEYTQATSASTGGTTSTLVASGASWTVNQWQGRCVNIPAAPLPVPTVASSTAANVGTITFTSAHGLVVGQLLTLTGMTPGGYNGTWPVLSVVSTTQVTVQLATNPGAGTVFGTGTANFMARIASNTATTLTLVDNVTGSATPFPVALTSSLNYTIGQVNRGQILPRQLYIQSSGVCYVEVIVSTPTLPIVLTSPTFATLASLGSNNSFAERDVSATALAGGEVVFAFVSPNNQLQVIDLSNLFPLYNTIKGAATDILTVAVTGTANVGAHFVCQEAMS